MPPPCSLNFGQLWSESSVARTWLGQEKYCNALQSFLSAPGAALKQARSIRSPQIASPVARSRYPHDQVWSAMSHVSWQSSDVVVPNHSDVEGIPSISMW